MKESNPLVRRILWTVLIVAVFGLMVFFADQSFKSTERNAMVRKLPVYNQAPDFQLTERSGRSVTRADLLGKIWVADFIFTTCPGPCPLISSRLQELQGMLDHADQVRLVSFTVDPTTDTPPVLSAYANRYLADPKKWLFLTGSEDAMRQVIVHGFLLPLTPNPADDAAIQGKFLHSTKLILVDPSGTVRGFYDAVEPESVPRVLKDIGFLMREQESNP